ncbi:MAG: MATE family efflux transporter [Atribacterota bacterium]|nr:MATE family efflux transporter [Atribacterota bacterium]MDD4896524.1 MATE family efflux transporter [Atribacterota bacterium]MDD5637904.1 MATE family efflux transporter [Atribacterota bacterium]
MTRRTSRDLTEGNIIKNLLVVSMPTMFGFFAQTLYDLIDMVWIGRISAQAVAGVAIFVTIFWFADIVNEIIGISSVSLISQNYGAGKLEKTKQIIEQSIFFKAIVSLIMSVILILILRPLSIFFSNDPMVVNHILDYGIIRSIFLPFMFSSFSVNTALRCIGDARSPMFIMILTSILNIVLDPILMFDTIPGTSIAGMGLGIRGAAIATVISTIVAFSIGLFILLSGKSYIKISFSGLFKLSKENMKKFSIIGLPTGLEMFFRQGGQFLLLKFVSIYGTLALATFGIGMKLFNLVFLPLLGLSMGGSTVAGQNLGANKIERTHRTAIWASLLGIFITGIIASFTLLFPEFIIKIFINQREVIEIGKKMVYIISPSFIAVAISMGLNTVFAGSGYNFPYLFSGIASRWFFQIPYSALVVYVLHLPITYIWIGFLVAEFIELLVIYIFYQKGRWKITRV